MSICFVHFKYLHISHQGDIKTEKLSRSVREKKKREKRERESACLCLCVCVCERKRERERERERERVSEQIITFSTYQTV